MGPFAKTLELLGDHCLGILGAGHLGRAIGSALVAEGFPRSRLLLAHRGSAKTRSTLEDLGLASFAVDRTELCRRSRVIFITLRPQDVAALADCPIHVGTLVVSFAAGVPLRRLPLPRAGIRCVRVMPSAPYTIKEKNGIAAVLPSAEPEPVVEEMLQALSLTPFPMNTEEDFDTFTPFGPCLPIALTYWNRLGKETDVPALARLAAEEGPPGYERILSWALSVVRPSGAEEGTSIEDFLASAATRGGVAESILQAITKGCSLAEALMTGVRRSRQLQDPFL